MTIRRRLVRASSPRVAAKDAARSGYRGAGTVAREWLRPRLASTRGGTS